MALDTELSTENEAKLDALREYLESIEQTKNDLIVLQAQVTELQLRLTRAEAKLAQR